MVQNVENFMQNNIILFKYLDYLLFKRKGGLIRFIVHRKIYEKYDWNTIVLARSKLKWLFILRFCMATKIIKIFLFFLLKIKMFLKKNTLSEVHKIQFLFCKTWNNLFKNLIRSIFICSSTCALKMNFSKCSDQWMQFSSRIFEKQKIIKNCFFSGRLSKKYLISNAMQNNSILFYQV